MKKKRLAFLLCLAMLMTIFIVPPITASPTPSVMIDGEEVTFDVSPMIDNGRTLVPLRAIFEKMGATVSWDDAAKTATAVKGGLTVVVTIGSTSPTINGVVKPIDVPAKIVNGRTLAPMRFVCEAFGGTVSWDAAAYIASVITSKGTGGSWGETPEDTVKRYLSAHQKFNLVEMGIYRDLTETGDSNETEELIDSELEVFLLNYLAANSAKMTYEITGSQINGDIASVTVVCKYVDAGSFFSEAIKEVLYQAVIDSLSGVERSDDEFDRMLAIMMKEEIEKSSDTYVGAEITVDCFKKENKWYITETNDELDDVVSSNLYSAVEEINDIFEEQTEISPDTSIKA